MCMKIPHLFRRQWIMEGKFFSATGLVWFGDDATVEVTETTITAIK